MAPGVLFDHRGRWNDPMVPARTEEMAMMYTEWLAMEHYRMHLIERWPDSDRKEASLAAVRSAIAGLESAAPAEASAFFCDVCHSRRRSATVIEYPVNPDKESIAA